MKKWSTLNLFVTSKWTTLLFGSSPSDVIYNLRSQNSALHMKGLQLAERTQARAGQSGTAHLVWTWLSAPSPGPRGPVEGSDIRDLSDLYFCPFPLAPRWKHSDYAIKMNSNLKSFSIKVVRLVEANKSSFRVILIRDHVQPVWPEKRAAIRRLGDGRTDRPNSSRTVQP